ncbi:MAG: hypothetical protein IJ137_08325 [Eubacterium sp.]|nr:hypothetical protein [Eubacterium sp.]
MTKKYLAITVAMVMSASLIAGCGASTTTTGSAESTTAAVVESQQSGDARQSEESVIYGQVSSVSDDSITIEVGTKKEMQGAPQEAPSDNSKQSDQGQPPSMLDLTGEEKTITITENTAIEKTGMGQPGGMNNDQNQPPQMPGDGESENQNDGSQPPAKPEDENSSNQDQNSDQNQPPQMPDGQESSDQNDNQGQQNNQAQSDNQGQQPGQAPQMETETIEAGDIAEGDTVEITLDENGNAEKITVMSMGQGGPGGNGGPGGQGNSGGQQGGPGGQQSAPESYEAVNEYSSDTEVSGETIASTGTDENAIHVTDGAKVTVTDSTITRSSEESSGGDNSSFYGTGAAVLTTEGTTVIKNSQIETDADGGAGVFSYGDGVSYVSGTTIKTEKGTSGGIHVAGGGTLYAWDTTAETNGQSSAAIRSDRGGGTMVVDGGSYTSNGNGSPAIYSTADITVHDADLTANGSEAICIEGNNSIRLFDCDLTGNMSDDSQNDTTWNVILYQSMSGDSEEGNSTFEMDGGTLTAKNGGMFYTTNTESTFTLKNVNITNADDAEFFLRCTGNANQRGWGSTGSNGADCTFTGIEQTMEGDVVWDSISQLDFYLTQNSSLTGAVINDESCAGSGGDGYCNLYIEKGSSWTVTADSSLSTLENAGTITDADGKTVTIKGSDGTVYVEGDSAYTITVNEYKDSADISGASSISSWSDYQVEQI